MMKLTTIRHDRLGAGDRLEKTSRRIISANKQTNKDDSEKTSQVETARRNLDERLGRIAVNNEITATKYGFTVDTYNNNQVPNFLYFIAAQMIRKAPLPVSDFISNES